MALIFAGSTGALSSSRTSRFIGPFLRWIYPGITERAIDRVQTVVRKGGHVSEYALLSVLLFRALQGAMPLMRRESPPGAGPSHWRWRHAAVALLAAVLYAASDEWHQGFVPSRDGRARDVLWDSAGAVAGLAGWWAWGRWRKRW
jgi:VanZ family protein